MKLSENDRKAAFVLLALLAVAAAAYVIFFAAPSDSPSDWQHFVSSVATAQEAAVYMDARGADEAVTRRIYQCGADIILSGRELFGGRTMNVFACDSTGCFSATSSSNASNTLTSEQVMGKLRHQPYVLIKKGTPGTKVFERHVEISMDETYSESCSFNVKIQ